MAAVTILLFHRVHPRRNPVWDPMDPALFEKVMAFMKRKYTVISLEEYFFKERRKYSRPPAIITFDDGYHDFIEYSFPVLKKYDLPATMFVVTDCIDQNKPTWTYLTDHLFFNTAVLSTAAPPAVKGFRMMKEWKNAEERWKYGARLKQHLKKIPAAKRMQVIDFYEKAFPDVEKQSQQMLSWDELRYLKTQGIEIGSHTVTHPPLATMEDERDIEKELHQSGMRIREELGSFPASVSYPVGSYNSKVKKLSHKVGYKLGLAVDHRIYNDDNGRFAIPRIELYNESFFKTRLRISGIISRVKKYMGR